MRYNVHVQCKYLYLYLYISAAELDEALSSSNPPEVAFHSPQPHPPPQQPKQQHNGGRLEQPERSGQPKTSERPTQSAKAFFSQLDWQAADAGYMAFAESESESESSSSSGDEELFNHPNHHHHHHHHGHGQQQKSGMTIPPRANGSIVTNASVRGGSQQEEEARQALSGVKLVDFATVDEKDVQSQMRRRPPVTTVSPPAPQHSQFGDFDPWGTTTTAARTMNLLDLEENLSPPSDSEQSEVRTVGTEAFQKASHSSQSSLGSSNQFDPFGPLSSDHGGNLGEVFGNPHAFVHSTSSENLPSHTSPNQGDAFSSNFLAPQHGAPHLASKRHYSAPNVAALGNVSFAPTLSDIPQSPKQVRAGSHSPSARPAHAHPQSTTAPNYTPTWTTTSSGRSSPYGGLQMGDPSAHLGFQSHSTGNLQQQMGGGGGGGRGGGRTDPFAGLGNVKQAAPSTVNQKSQPTPQNKPPMTSRPTYQYYGQQLPRSQPQMQPSAQPAKSQSHKPNYGSVIGDRTERGTRAKTGKGKGYTLTQCADHPAVF